MSVLTAVKEVFTKREREQALSYSQTVKALGEDQELDPAKIAKLLEATHTPFAKLEADVQLYKTRQQNKLQLERCESARIESRQLNNQLAELDNEIEAWLKPRREKAKALTEQRDAADRLAATSKSIVKQLTDSAPSVLSERIKSILTDITASQQRLDYLRGHTQPNLNARIGKLQAELLECERATSKPRNPADNGQALAYDRAIQARPDIDRELGEAKVELQRVHSEAGELSERISVLNAERAKFESMKLEVWPVLED